MASFVPEHDNIVEAVILEIANQHFGIVRTRDGRVRRVIGMERAIGIPEQAKGATRTWPRTLLDHEETIPTCMVRINHPDRTGEILCAIAQGLFGRINKPDSDSFFVRLLQLERHPGLGVLAPLECGGAHGGPSSLGVCLVPLRLLLSLILTSCSESTTGRGLMRSRCGVAGMVNTVFL